MKLSGTQMIIGAIIIFGILISSTINNSKNTKVQELDNNRFDSSNAQTKADDFMITQKAKELIKTKLKDADSAKFQNVELKNNGIKIVCGEVNSKNSFGAYSGFQRFVSSALGSYLEENVTDFDAVWDKYCR